MFRKSFSVKINCWFCGVPNKVLYMQRNSFLCSSCEQYNGFTEEGHYNREIPAQSDAKLNQFQPSATKGSFNTGSDVLCQRCNNNQRLKYWNLSNFEPVSEDRFDIEYEERKQQLESVYRLCSTCERKVENVLNIQNKQLEEILNKQSSPADSFHRAMFNGKNNTKRRLLTHLITSSPVTLTLLLLTLYSTFAFCELLEMNIVDLKWFTWLLKHWTSIAVLILTVDVLTMFFTQRRFTMNELAFYLLLGIVVTSNFPPVQSHLELMLNRHSPMSFIHLNSLRCGLFALLIVSYWVLIASARFRSSSSTFRNSSSTRARVQQQQYLAVAPSRTPSPSLTASDSGLGVERKGIEENKTTNLMGTLALEKPFSAISNAFGQTFSTQTMVPPSVNVFARPVPPSPPRKDTPLRSARFNPPSSYISTANTCTSRRSFLQPPTQPLAPHRDLDDDIEPYDSVSQCPSVELNNQSCCSHHSLQHSSVAPSTVVIQSSMSPLTNRLLLLSIALNMMVICYLIVHSGYLSAPLTALMNWLGLATKKGKGV